MAQATNVWPKRVNDYVIPESPQRASATSLECCYHKKPQISHHLERTCWRTGRMAKGNYAKKITVAKSETHQRLTSTLKDG